MFADMRARFELQQSRRLQRALEGLQYLTEVGTSVQRRGIGTVTALTQAAIEFTGRASDRAQRHPAPVALEDLIVKVPNPFVGLKACEIGFHREGVEHKRQFDDVHRRNFTSPAEFSCLQFGSPPVGGKGESKA